MKFDLEKVLRVIYIGFVYQTWSASRVSSAESLIALTPSPKRRAVVSSYCWMLIVADWRFSSFLEAHYFNSDHCDDALATLHLEWNQRPGVYLISLIKEWHVVFFSSEPIYFESQANTRRLGVGTEQVLGGWAHQFGVLAPTDRWESMDHEMIDLRIWPK